MNDDKQQDDLNDPLLRKVKQQLDDSVEDLDAEVLSRLNQARSAALQANEKRSWRMQPMWGGMATASVALVVAVLWLGGESPQMNNMVVEDLELLSSTEAIELYEDYEFYQWLNDEDLAS